MIRQPAARSSLLPSPRAGLHLLNITTHSCSSTVPGVPMFCDNICMPGGCSALPNDTGNRQNKTTRERWKTFRSTISAGTYVAASHVRFSLCHSSKCAVREHSFSFSIQQLHTRGGFCIDVTSSNLPATRFRPNAAFPAIKLSNTEPTKHSKMSITQWSICLRSTLKVL